jgi:hypothetical protein
MCFDTLIVTATFHTMKDRLVSSLELDIAPLRRRLPRLLRVNRRKIVIAESLWGTLEAPIKAHFTSAELVKLPANLGIDRAIQMMSGAGTLIGDHLTSLIHMIWMAGGKATVIDASPKEFACNPWARNMAQKANLSYIRIFDEDKCICPTFRCYPQDKLWHTAPEVATRVLEKIEKLQPNPLSAP